MKLSPQIQPHEQLHTIAIKKGDVQIVAQALSFYHDNWATAKLSKEKTDLIRELFEFFARVYESKGADP